MTHDVGKLPPNNLSQQRRPTRETRLLICRIDPACSLPNRFSSLQVSRKATRASEIITCAPTAGAVTVADPVGDGAVLQM